MRKLWSEDCANFARAFFCSFIENRRMTIIRKRHQGYDPKEEPSEEGLGYKEVDIEALLGNHTLS